MIWRSTLVFFTGLAALSLSGENLQAATEKAPVLLSQSAVSNSNTATSTNQAVPSATSPERIQQVKALQQELKTRGYYNGPIDGIYGPVTDAAIRNLRGSQSPPSTASPVATAPQIPITTAQANNPGTTDVLNQEANSGNVQAKPPSEEAASEEAASEAEPPGTQSDITIGDEVSPDTGVTPPTSNSNGPTESAPSGPNSMLWTGLALMAALGSFGVGFILVNRTNNDPEEDPDSVWGPVPDDIPKVGNASQQFTPMNGHRTNGSHADVVIETPAAVHQPQAELPTVVPASNSRTSPTTRLAKVDVMDELVGNLQLADPAKRRKAIWELGQRGNSSAVQHLVNGMVDADSKEKSLILAALSEIGIRSLKPMSRALAIALQDENPDVRKNAIRDLTRVYDLVTQISQMLGHATEDEDSEVRRTAEWALGQLNRIREAPKIESSLSSLEAARSTSSPMTDAMKNLNNQEKST